MNIGTPLIIYRININRYSNYLGVTLRFCSYYHCFYHLFAVCCDEYSQCYESRLRVAPFLLLFRFVFFVLCSSAASPYVEKFIRPLTLVPNTACTSLIAPIYGSRKGFGAARRRTLVVGSRKKLTSCLPRSSATSIGEPLHVNESKKRFLTTYFVRAEEIFPTLHLPE